MTDITQILAKNDQGDTTAAEKLLPLVYEELRKLAVARLANEKPGQTVQATALVHDAYIRLVDVEKIQHWNGRGHFFAAAARAMQRILVEIGRHKRSLKAGGGHTRIELSQVAAETRSRPIDMLELDEALQQLELEHHRKADLVRLRFFAGLTQEEAARALGISVSTADNDWAYAKAWLRVAMTEKAQKQKTIRFNTLVIRQFLNGFRTELTRPTRNLTRCCL